MPPQPHIGASRLHVGCTYPSQQPISVGAPAEGPPKTLADCLTLCTAPLLQVRLQSDLLESLQAQCRGEQVKLGLQATGASPADASPPICLVFGLRIGVLPSPRVTSNSMSLADAALLTGHPLVALALAAQSSCLIADPPWPLMPRPCPPAGQAGVELRPQPDGGACSQGLPRQLRQGRPHPQPGGGDGEPLSLLVCLRLPCT